MRAQRVREGESRAEMQTAKWTAEGTVNEWSRLRNGFPEAYEWSL